MAGMWKVPAFALTAISLVTGTAAADTFGGFSGVDAPYIVSPDRVCSPLPVKAGLATGAPSCAKASADVIAKLSVKPPSIQRGDKASFAATATGKTLTVTTKSGTVVVAWNASDPIGKVVEVYASQYDDRVAVAYTVRRLGKEVTEVVAFEVTKTTGRESGTGTGTGSGSGSGTGTGTTGTGTGSGTGSGTGTGTGSGSGSGSGSDPRLVKAITTARQAGKGKGLAAWQAVLAIEAKHSEALFRIAVLQASTKQTADAMASLGVLAANGKPDAIEWLVEARFDPAFAGMRSDPKFRAAVGLDHKATEAYERFMGFGGQWEQTGTSCDKPEVKLVAQRDRSFKLRVKTVCEGQVFNNGFSGTWRVENNEVMLTLPTKGQKASAKDDAPCKFEAAGDEDALRCALGRDLEFVVLPTRR